MRSFSRFTLGAVAVTSLALGLAACGGGGGGAKATGDSSALVTNSKAAAQASGSFGSVVTLPDGTAFTLDKLAIFTPTGFSSGQIAGQTNNSFEISVKNGTSAALDLSALILTTTTSNGDACVDIFDGQVGLEGPPADPVAVGATATFKWAVSCPGKSGDPLDISMTTDGTTNVDVKGKLV
ncbi:MAG TPA: hypothetical protein VMV52_08455 [Candidatus Nanopelagicaceae bacterium]|nr:hypothetical protein [Candidatus Nanopelagicaceae bacterium]